MTITYRTPSLTEEGQYVDWDGKVYDVVHLDFETYYGPKYTLTSLTYPEYAFDERFKFHGVGIAINNEPYEWITESEMESEFSNIPWDDIVLVCQNALFDAPLLLWKFGIRAKFYHDTKAFSRAIYPGQKADLDFMLQREFPNNPEKWKGKQLADFKGFRDLNPAQESVMAEYCKGDVEGMRALWQRWVVRMPYSEIRLQEETLRLYLEPKFHLDRDMLEEALKEETEETKRLVKLSGINKTTLSSNQKFAEFVEQELGLKIPLKISPRTNEPIPALAQSDPELIRLMADNPQHKKIWDARRSVKSTGQKARAKRMIQLADYFDNMIPVPLNYAGAHTLRWSGAQKVNFQSMKRGGKVRKSLRAMTKEFAAAIQKEVGQGKLVYVVDSSNIEARKVSWLANEIGALQKFRAGIDTYNDMAEKIYGYPVDRKAKDENGEKIFEEEGNVGKTARLGLGFGMGGAKFQYTLASGPMGADPIYKPLDFCQHAVNVFREDNPAIVTYWRTMQEAIYNMMLPGTHYYIGPILVEYESLTLPNGVALRYPNIRHREVDFSFLEGEEVVKTTQRNIYCDRKDGDRHQKLYGGIVCENVTQRAARDVVAEQVLEVMDYFQDVELGLLVHDEGVFIMPDDHPDERMAALIEIFSTPRPWCPDIPLAAEGGYSESYSK